MTRGPVDTLESSRSVGDRQLHTVLAVEPTTTTQLVRHVALGATSGFASAIGREYPSPCVLHGPMAEACVCVCVPWRLRRRWSSCGPPKKEKGQDALVDVALRNQYTD